MGEKEGFKNKKEGDEKEEHPSGTTKSTWKKNLSQCCSSNAMRDRVLGNGKNG